jgi:hypothetical protein
LLLSSTRSVHSAADRNGRAWRTHGCHSLAQCCQTVRELSAAMRCLPQRQRGRSIRRRRTARSGQRSLCGLQQGPEPYRTPAGRQPSANGNRAQTPSRARTCASAAEAPACMQANRRVGSAGTRGPCTPAVAMKRGCECCRHLRPGLCAGGGLDGICRASKALKSAQQPSAADVHANGRGGGGPVSRERPLHVRARDYQPRKGPRNYLCGGQRMRSTRTNAAVCGTLDGHTKCDTANTTTHASAGASTLA